MEPPPSRLPRGLEPVRTLGVGGFGYVVHARDPNLGRDVAVKFVYGGGHVTDAVARMLREGQALARLRHPAIIHVYEAVRVDSDIALLMEYVDGGDLSGRVNRPDFTVGDRLGVLGQVAAGLAESHAAGIVHRDLKPANILLRDTTAGVEAKIADFGLARLGRDAAAFRTEQGVAAYTPGYGAPEQMIDPDHETERIDWYSFAVVAFRLLRGTMPTMEERPGAAEDLFAAALSLDPGERIDPRTLVQHLAAVPQEAWTPVRGRGFGDAPPMPEAEATGAPADGGDAATVPPATDAPREPTTVRSGAPVTVATPATRREEGLPEPSTTWVDVPVFRPPRPPWHRRRGPRVAVGLVVGLLVGLAAGVLVVIAR